MEREEEVTRVFLNLEHYLPGGAEHWKQLTEVKKKKVKSTTKQKNHSGCLYAGVQLRKSMFSLFG